jgi:hypothetical protein
MQLRFSFWFVMFLLLVSGCKNAVPKPDGLPKLYPCEISVTQDGAPLEDAAVRLLSKDTENGWQVEGLTASNGIAVLKTAVHFPGVPKGDYTVLIAKIEVEKSTVPPPPSPQSPEFAAWQAAKGLEKLDNYYLVKPEFNNPKKTPHSITVKEGKNEGTFEVGKPIREKVK